LQGLFPCHYNVNYEQTVPGDQQQPTNDAPAAAIKDNSKQSFLDPNHTHFVLVDNGTDGYGGEIEFRAHLEQQIGKRASDHGELMIVLS
jgi:SLOG in TRPM